MEMADRHNPKIPVCLPKEDLRNSVENCILIYKQETMSLMMLFLQDFSYQREAIFGFGPYKNKETVKLLKVSEYIKSEEIKSEENIQKLDKAHIHNLNEAS